ncbi:VWA domain-containing protein [Nocardioides sp.]|uniref:VWA domain-containing protein n=1 Tax=Nocardioides sp. TaxID=35761 RepID=UPI002734A275|nr:VWA domain-containing protein [Nocardioides sp.]MDP3890930.1 VWA domain-containing protein [Nocardioides sp.]
MTRPFPFSAIVGADQLGLALCLSVVSPQIGGVLVRGEKGTAKSTMVRALTSVLPPVDVVEGCRFACSPKEPDPTCPDAGVHTGSHTERPVRLVELPVGASEDRVIGSLHLDRLVSSREVAFEPGLLASAHRGLLYVDEVNLLPDHLVDTLLDAAAMGRARVEREGVSVTHAAAFVLVGTMNPEEGELRPQLLDRFGLAVDVLASRVPADRVEVMRRRLAYEREPAGFADGYDDADAEVADRIARARSLLDSVVLSDDALVRIASICAEYDVDGLRGDLVLARAAVAHAAWCGRTSVTTGDIRVAARLALPHRRRRNPFDNHDDDDLLEELLDRHAPESDDDPDPDDPEPGPDTPPAPNDDADDAGEGNEDRSDDGERGPDHPDASAESPEQPAADHPSPELDQSSVEPGEGDADEVPAAPPARRTHQAAGTPYAARRLALDTVGTGATGRRSAAHTTVGRHLRAVPLDHRLGQGLSVTGTVLASVTDLAAGTAIEHHHLRRSLREGKEGNLVVFVVDTSGSMGAAKRVREVKTAVVSLLLDAYQRRDRVAVVTFGGDGATVALQPTAGVDRAERMLSDVPTGGRTPLAEGLVAAADLVRREQLRDPQRRALLVVLTDGRANSGPKALDRARRTASELGGLGHAWVVVDAEDPRAVVRLGLAGDLARRLGADHLPLGDVAAPTLSRIVRTRGAA